MPGFVSEPNFEEDISIDVEPEDDENIVRQKKEDAEDDSDSDEYEDLK
jgi:hypothetical protein